MATAAATQSSDKRWYIVHAYSNFEKKVAESIREQAKQRGLEELFELVLVPTEKVTEVRRGRKIDAERKFFPGYVLVKMKLTDEAFHLIKNTPKVTGFLGAENKPMPISESEAMRILHQVQEGVERPKASVSFEIGENVRVADGPFASFSGVVEEIDEARSRVKVAVSIFGRATPVKDANGPSATRTFSPISNEIDAFGRSTPSCTWCRMRIASGSEIGIGLFSAPRKPVTFGVFLIR